MANEESKALVEQATQAMQAGEFEKGLGLLDQAIAIDVRNSDSHVLRGVCLSHLKRNDEAEAAFRQAILLSAYNTRAYFNFAVHQNSLGKKNEALELAREAASVDPRNAGARQFVAQLEAELTGGGKAPAGAHETVENPHDPLSAAPPPAAPPPSTSQEAMPPGVTPLGVYSDAPVDPQIKQQPIETRPPSVSRPSASDPYASQAANMKSPFTAGYVRAGYDESVHSLPWVEKMGSGWTAMGWAIWAIILLIGIITTATMFSSLQEAMKGGSAGVQAWEANHLAALSAQSIGMVLLGVWLVIDFVDRRTSAGWIVGLVLSCCCFLWWLVTPIYLLAGRKD